ncbi:aminotransferase class I and II family protein [Paraburkholderia xenovorans LB400]|uniref:Transcriptional regulator, GntR family n=1 Tax=Paraburkholderia xenovorans (strain LB400) TaxID=266265 RepID=Q13L45_PARXL|nr:PLP-dependent aminotransferase family protein [Paraburkholderia xenovorans]ABE35194.1 transcriptional regulator, GntR family [Paraburkholderia xenovorans LB400]AIP35664.1 aminotransferase class I and II family protein [Paraburkholderia xenovorans LB400]NPT35748.1 aminotransferase class I/II-fold pyridoxal phosphate-dependent enzyme [Paraburkholderia xenovorans]
MEIHIAVEGHHDLSGQIYRQLRAGILEGRLAGGTRLPSTRDLATQLGVSRKTTLDVFERLLSEGYLSARAGSGTFVADGLERLPVERSPHARAVESSRERLRAKAAARAQPLWEEMPERLALPRPSALLPQDFIGGATDKTLFPFEVWRRCVNRALRAQSRGPGAYRDAAGEQELRLAISRYLAFNRAVASNWEDVIVTQGAQHALDLLARISLRAGEVAAIEDPGYSPAHACLKATGARVVPVPVDAQGLIVSKLPDKARLVYVTPSHQFPLGMPMSLERRVELLEWAQKRGAVIIEDDYDCEYRFEGRAMEPLKSLDRAGLVAYVGTFSKTIFPELRVGYVVPPASLYGPLLKARQITDWHGCTLTQTALASFMLNGDFAKHLRRMHKTYAARRAMLLDHLHGGLAPWFEPIVPTAGIHMAAHLKAPLTEQAVVSAAREASIGLYGLAAFHLRVKARPGLIFGYGNIAVEQIDAALTKLAGILPRLAQ